MLNLEAPSWVGQPCAVFHSLNTCPCLHKAPSRATTPRRTICRAVIFLYTFFSTQLGIPVSKQTPTEFFITRGFHGPKRKLGASMTEVICRKSSYLCGNWTGRVWPRAKRTHVNLINGGGGARGGGGGVGAGGGEGGEDRQWGSLASIRANHTLRYWPGDGAEETSTPNWDPLSGRSGLYTQCLPNHVVSEGGSQTAPGNASLQGMDIRPNGGATPTATSSQADSYPYKSGFPANAFFFFFFFCLFLSF